MTTEPAEDKRPASRRVADALLEQIEVGNYKVGTSLPTYRQLATDYNVAVNTAIAAVRVLRDLGVVTIRPNAGARVRDRTADIDVSGELHDVQAELAELRGRVQRAVVDIANLEERLSNVVGRLPDGG